MRPEVVGRNGCLRFLRRTSESCCRMLRELISGQEYRVRSLRVRNVEGELKVKEANIFIYILCFVE